MADSFQKDDADKDASSPLDAFSDRLDRVRADHDPEEKSEGGGAAWGNALRLSTELIAGLFVGILLGYGLDRWLGTSPWLLLAGIGIGFAAGLRNISRSMK
ncbi:MAG: AtpZ/AtpI family protein [Pseudomonadota bacterium]